MGKRYQEKESKEEMLAAIEVGSTSGNDILTFNKLAVTHRSYESKKNRKGERSTSEVDVRGQDVLGSKAWEGFLSFKGYINARLISLTKDVDKLTEEYYSFLVDNYTDVFKSGSDRYSNLDLEGRAWLRKVCRLAAKHHLMDNKLQGYIRSLGDEGDDEDYFCSEYALYLYTLIRLGIKVWLDRTMRGIQHIVKDPENRDHLLKGIMDEHYDRLRRVPFPQRDNVIHLLQGEPEDEVANG